MPIINLNPPTPIDPNKAKALSLKSQINSKYRDITNLFAAAKEFVWNNLDLTPQQAFDLFGKDAADLVKVSAAYVALVQTYTGVAPQVVPDGYTVQPNSDGTV